MSRRFARLGRLGAFLVAVAASSARADDEERVLLIGADPTRAPLPRLAAELETLGFRVIRGKSESRPSIWSAEVAVRRAHAVGAIHVDATDGTLRVEVTNSGGSRPARSNGSNGSNHADGHGLIGMRERVGVYGGTLTTGAEPGGGFRVTATMTYDGEDT